MRNNGEFVKSQAKEISLRGARIAELVSQNARQAEMLAERDAEVAGRDAQITALTAERDAQVAERDAQITALTAERDAQVAERDAQISALAAERDAQVAEREARISALTAERDAQIAERDARISAALAERETQVAERDARISALTAERDAQIAERDARISALTAERDAQIAERDARIAAVLAEREMQVAERDVRISALTAERDAQIAERDARIAEVMVERDCLVADNDKIRAVLSGAEDVISECRHRFPADADFCVCNVCQGKSEFRFRGRVLNKYDIRYYLCPHCGHVQTEEPYWLEEAYGSAISVSDTGIVRRNQSMREVTLAVIARFFDPSVQVLEYAGGYGLLTRMLRDSGIECHWHDKYAKPVFATGFEDDGQRRYDIVTAFEALEHFADPLAELKTIFGRTGTLVFSEELLPDPVPAPADWWYYCLEHGQHINLYSRKTLEFLAARFGKRLLYHGSVGLLTDRGIGEEAFAACVDNCHSIVEGFRWRSLSVSDMDLMINKMAEGK